MSGHGWWRLGQVAILGPEIAISGVGIGDYVELNGEKLNEQLFEATQISVTERFKDVSASNDNKSKKH